MQSALARIETNAIYLPDFKTGRRAVPLREAARTPINALPGDHDSHAFWFSRHAEGRGAHSIIACWRTLCGDAEPDRMRLHGVRHTTASQTVMPSEDLRLIGMLLGHGRHRKTAGYAHVDHARPLESSERIGSILLPVKSGIYTSRQ